MACLKTVVLFFLSLLLFESCTKNLSKSPNENPALNGKDLFVEWGRANRVPFDWNNKATIDSLIQTMAQDIGDSRVVMLSEGFHNCEEMLQLQYELITYLVTNKGFDVITTESGLPESKYINDYIHGQDSIPNMWGKSLALLYSEWQTGRATINWLAEYNQANNNKVDYYGADIGGFYRDWEFPFEQVFAYLDTIDAPTSKQLKEDLAFFFKTMKPYAAYYYVNRLSPQQKNDLALLLEDLIQTFTKNETNYLQQSNKKDYEWVLQSVKSMRMAENYYRNFSSVKDTTKNKVKIYLGGSGRELAMAENIKWLLSYKKESKVIIINHVIHTKTASQYQGEFYQHFTPMGQLLKQHLQEELFIIGMTYGQGNYWKTWQMPSIRTVDTIPPTDPNGLESVLHSIAPQDYYLNLQNPPLLTYNWMYKNTTIRENDYNIVLQPFEWDACFYLKEVTPAVPAE